ncbi:MAG: hypothetical protein ACO3JL_14145, partial [Myxococcota bacterium]
MKKSSLTARAIPFLLAALGQACSCEPPPSPLPTTRIDSGFTMEDHAFRFANFGGNSAKSRINEELLVRLHGKEAVCKGDSATCKLRPVAKEYMKSVNEAMRGGRCEGFALLAGHLYKGDVMPDELGGEVAAAMDIDDNRPLGSEIAYWFMTQYLRDVVATSTSVLGAESAIRALAESFSQESPTMYRLGIARIDENGRLTGGHAVLPIAVGPGTAEGQYIIYLYDNNYPGEERQLHVNTKLGEWRYEASINPEECSAVYVGNADNGNPLYLAALEPRLGRHPCAFCDEGTGEAAMQQVFGSAGVEVTVADESGNVAGERQGRIYTDIPGSSVSPVFSAENVQDDTSVVVNVPEGEVSVRVAPSGTKAQEEDQEVHLFSDAVSVTIANLDLEEGEEGNLDVDPESNGVRYEPPFDDQEQSTLDGGQIVTVNITTASGEEIQIEITIPEEGCDELSIAIDEESGNPVIEVDLDDDGDPSDEETVAVKITISDGDGEREDVFTGQVPVSDDGSTEILVDEWEGDGSEMGVNIDTDGDGAPD